MPRWVPAAALTAFVVLLVGLPVLARAWPVEWLVLVAGFYRAGALVFGGGHVVLPMLEVVVVGSGAVAQADLPSLDTALPGVPWARRSPSPGTSGRWRGDRLWGSWR